MKSSRWNSYKLKFEYFKLYEMNGYNIRTHTRLMQWLSGEIHLGVVGGRNIMDADYVHKCIWAWIRQHGVPSSIISGGASGVDTIAEEWALRYGFSAQICRPKKQERQFLLKRNLQIAAACTHLLAIPSKGSRGTWHTAKHTSKLGKPVSVITA